MTRDNALRITDLVFKLLVPALLLLLGFIGTSIDDRIESLACDISSLQKEVQSRVEDLHVKQAIMEEQIRVLKGG